MIFVWRGWGPLGLVALLLPTASCAGLFSWNPIVSIAAFAVTLLGGGVACLYYGRKWNQGSRFHTMYWLPLEVWGWVYIVVGGLFISLIVAGLIRRAITG